MIVTVLLQGSVANIVSTTPEDAAKDFLEGLKNNEPQVMEKYMDNSYINFICNVEGDEGVVDRMDDALFQNFSYEVDKVAAKDDVAVAKVTVTCNDFSQVSAACASISRCCSKYAFVLSYEYLKYFVFFRNSAISSSS